MGRLGMMVSHALGCTWEKCRMLGPRGSPKPSQAQLHDRGLSVKFCASTRLAYNLEMEFIRCRENDERRKQQPKSQSLMADCALVEKASRGGVLQPFWGDEGEPLGMKYVELGSCRGSTMSGKGCWDLVEVNCVVIEVHNPEWNSVRVEPQDLRGEKEINWEESSLAKFIRVFTGVYGPFTKEDRESLWDEFGAIRGIWGKPWFAQVIDDLELIDLPLQGGSFTWSGALQQVEYWDQVESDRKLTEEEISIKKEAKEGYAKWDEVHSALMDMNEDMTPGPDGFIMAFWQCCWEFVKEEVLEMFKEFH
ncbi:hypothetical protein CK203_096886 [Vitis vinifera]|uniref:Uncharacterized protein n=1 Tax=Vitis vinifera TaxID=29760 RepID=A0A438EQY8_VITVI|nr:hypothetical protein CK203_096886 [Vitis vinifera]